jgi:hypothetical protein
LKKKPILQERKNSKQGFAERERGIRFAGEVAAIPASSKIPAKQECQSPRTERQKAIKTSSLITTQGNKHYAGLESSPAPDTFPGTSFPLFFTLGAFSHF